MRALRIMMTVGLIIGAVLNTLTAGAAEPVKIAILDSGSNIAYKEGISLIDCTVKDYNGHGTLMASIIKEVCPNIDLYIIKVMGRNGLAVNEKAIVLGLEWAISKDVDVINLSLRVRDSERLHDAIRKAHDKGIVIVAAAGNTVTKMNNVKYEVAYPAKYKETIGVGALDRYGKIHHDTMKGEEVDIFSRGYKGNHAGTSVAAAYASGFAAKVISENPDKNAQEIKDIMIQGN